MDALDPAVLVALGMVLILLVGGLAFVKAARWSRAGSTTDIGINRRITLRDTPADYAEALLRDVLDAHEYAQLTRHAYVDVSSPNDPQRFYRIPGYPGLVCVYENGVPVRNLCIQPVDPLPSADVIAIHKLMIQCAEDDYLACSRQFTIS